MTSLPVSPLNALVRKLQSIGTLLPEDRHALEGLPVTFRTLAAKQDIVRQGDRPGQSCILLSGWACRYKLLGGGGRQILAVHLPGDIPDLQSLHLPTMDHSISALTEVKLALVPHASIRALTVQHPGLAALFWRATLIEAAIFREWIINLGQRSAAERIAHLVCEVFTLLEQVGLAHPIGDKRTILWPITQNELADATGMSAVHANRSLQDLRGRGLIEDARGWVTILDWPGLQTLAGFVPDYLSLAPVGQAGAPQ